MASECKDWGEDRTAPILTFARQNLPTRAYQNAHSRAGSCRLAGTYWYETKTMSGLTCIVAAGSSIGRSSSMKFFQPQ